MANPTTNYGFVLPTPTDLVTDLPADFDVALQGVDTRLKALQPGTTAGDLAYSSATANTNVRLGIGTSGQLLSVASGVPAWATIPSGGMTLLASGSLSGSAVNLTSISGTFIDLRLYVRNFQPVNDNVGLSIRFNNDNNARYFGYGAVTNGAFSLTSLEMTSGCDNTVAEGLIIFDIPDYTNATTFKIIQSVPALNNATTTANLNFDPRNGVYNQLGAITEINMFAASGNLTGGTYALYGVK